MQDQDLLIRMSLSGSADFLLAAPLDSAGIPQQKQKHKHKLKQKALGFFGAFLS